MEKLDGVSLDEPFYWNLTREERDVIRAAFIESERYARILLCLEVANAVPVVYEMWESSMTITVFGT